MNEGPVAAVLMCHAPIVIPAIAGARARACEATTRAMALAADRVVASGARTVLLISPHLPRHDRSYGLLIQDPVAGDFGAFGRPDIQAALPGHATLTHTLLEEARGSLCATRAPLDHGALVPLWFLAQTAFPGRVLVLGLPWETHATPASVLATALRRALDATGEPWAVLASGDCSHALQPGAPGGFHPDGARFDAALVEAVAQGRWCDLRALTGPLRSQAAEDVVETLHLTQALLNGVTRPATIWSYEGPFGVGYLVADLLP